MNCARKKLTDHPRERGNVSPPAPAKIIIVPLNRYLIIPSPFFLRLMDIYQALVAAMYLIYLYLFFFAGLGWLYRGGSQHQGRKL